MEGQPTDVSIVMPLGGRISGTLRDATSGAPLAGCVNVELPAPPPAWPTHVRSTCSDADGRYVIRALSPGTYLINANSSHHASFYFDGVKGPAAATPVAVAAGATATADFALPWQFDLELTLMGSPVPGAGLEVTLYGAAGQTVATTTTTTTTDSIARLDVPQTGTYRIGVHDPQGRFLDTYYNGKADLASSDPVTLYAGFGLHLAMGMLAPEHTGSISGLVIDAQSGLPLAGATVSAHRDGDDAVTSTQTGADGAYTLAGLSAGTYRVEFAATNHTTSWYAWVPAEWGDPHRHAGDCHRNQWVSQPAAQHARRRRHRCGDRRSAGRGECHGIRRIGLPAGRHDRAGRPVLLLGDCRPLPGAFRGRRLHATVLRGRPRRGDRPAGHRPAGSQ